MKTTMVKIYNNSGYDHNEREFKRFRHIGRLSVDSAKKIVDRKYPLNKIQPEFNVTKFIVTLFSGSNIVSSEVYNY